MVYRVSEQKQISAFYSPFSAMVSIHFSGGCDPGSSPGRGSSDFCSKFEFILRADSFKFLYNT